MGRHTKMLSLQQGEKPHKREMRPHYKFAQKDSRTVPTNTAFPRTSFLEHVLDRTFLEHSNTARTVHGQTKVFTRRFDKWLWPGHSKTNWWWDLWRIKWSLDNWIEWTLCYSIICVQCNKRIFTMFLLSLQRAHFVSAIYNQYKEMNDTRIVSFGRI